MHIIYMTDLAMAYGDFAEMAASAPMPAFPSIQTMDNKYAAPQPQQNQLPQIPTTPPPQAPRVMQSMQQPNEVQYQPPEQMYMQAPSPAKQPQVYEDGFLARVTSRRFEVLKVVMFALIILFAISMDRLFTHYIFQYVSESVLTKAQELLIRAAYPIGILLVIWFVKAM